MNGICCTCQELVPLRSSATPMQQMLKLGYEEAEVERTHGESIHYLCCSHDAFGEHCDGSEMCPQTVVK